MGSRRGRGLETWVKAAGRTGWAGQPQAVDRTVKGALQAGEPAWGANVP